VASGLAKNVLRQIWDLADVTKDGKLDLYEFVIAMFFADMVKEGHDELPAALDHSMIPPAKK
jgi:EH domain-containing protein 1